MLEEDDNLDYEYNQELNESMNKVDSDFLLHRNLDIDLDIFCNEKQKELKKLPTNLRLVKEIIYQFLLPKVETVISDLEDIKLTPNYEEDVKNIPINNILEEYTCNSAITAINCFNNHNISGKTDNKIIYGNATGDLVIVDLEQDRNILTEKNVFNNNCRIEILKTSTIKYFDTFISKIIVVGRGQPFVNIYSYNHSYASLSLDESINVSTVMTSIQSGGSTKGFLFFTKNSSVVFTFSFRIAFPASSIVPQDISRK